jgi:hypothetical protein
MKFWQIIAAILIWAVFYEIYNNTNGFDGPASYIVLALAVWAMVATAIWLCAFYALRLIDRPAERYENQVTADDVDRARSENLRTASAESEFDPLGTAAVVETGPRND